MKRSSAGWRAGPALSGAILDPLRQGMELRAECEGSQYEPYQVSAILTGKGVGGTAPPRKATPGKRSRTIKGPVEHAIHGRDGRTYQQAVQYLKRMKAVYKSLDAAADWDAHLQSLRAEYRHLPALQDKMRQARL